MAIFDFLRRGNLNTPSKQDDIIKDLSNISEITENSVNKISEVLIAEDNSNNHLLNGSIESITESVEKSPEAVTKILSTDDYLGDKLLTDLKTMTYSSDEVYSENEEMSRDSVVGGAMEVIAEDAIQRDERNGKIVYVESSDEGLARFLQDFLDSNVEVEKRIWTWAFGIVEHGDFKLRRREYYANTDEESGVKSVYYEDVINPYKVTRVEYMGKPLGFRDEDFDDNKVTFEKPEMFVHFMSVKNSRKEKIKLTVRSKDNKMEEVICYKVFGTCIVDNARYIYRIVNLLDNMLVLSRVGRSTQYNLVKVEVGNASPTKTQQILSDVRRRLEGSTKLNKNRGIKSDPSPIPVNSNVYIPTREGKGDIQVESINESVDIRSITDIDYFKDKEFAALKVPKAYLGMNEDSMSVLANNSLVRMDSRYARSVQRVQTILINGITDLCNNYLKYRGRRDDVDKFVIKMRPLDTTDAMSRVEEMSANMQAMDAIRASLIDGFGEYIDKAKVLKTTLELVGITPLSVGNEEFNTILDEMEKGTYKEENHKIEVPDEEGGGNAGW